MLCDKKQHMDFCLSAAARLFFCCFFLLLEPLLSKPIYVFFLGYTFFTGILQNARSLCIFLQPETKDIFSATYKKNEKALANFKLHHFRMSDTLYDEHAENNIIQFLQKYYPLWFGKREKMEFCTHKGLLKHYMLVLNS